MVALAVLALSCSPDVLVPRPTSRVVHAMSMTPVAACPPTTVAPPALVPHDAAAIIGIDLAALQKSAWFPDLDALAHAHPRLAPVLEAIEACGVGPGDRREVTIGLSAHDDAMMVLRAADLGTPATLDCVAKELKTALGVTPWTRRTTGCTSVLDIAGGEGRGHTLDSDTVVIATRGWIARVDDRVAGRGRSAMTGTLAWARPGLDMTRTVWFATQLSAAQAGRLGTQAAALRQLAGGVDVARGLSLEVTAGFVHATDAADAARELDAELRSIRIAAPMFGLPAGIVDRVTVTARGSRLRVHGAISESDLRALRRLLEGDDPGAAVTPGASSGI